RQIGDDRRRKKITVAATLVDWLRRFTAERDLPAFLLRQIDIEFYFIELRLVHDCPLIRFLFERIADFQFRRFVDETVDEIFVGGAFDEYTRTTQADLALVCERRSHTAGDGSLQVGIGEDDVWVLPAEFE